MLSRLTVSNLAVIENAEAEFSPGLNVLTGETGAGKSVLMRSLELAAGARADGSIIRDGAKDARVEAEFTLVPGSVCALAVDEILSSIGIERCDGGALLVRRTLSQSGGKVWINDCPATVATLRRIGAAVVDIHGPRANQSLLDEVFQRRTLDSFGNISGSKPESAYKAAWETLCALKQRYAALEEGASEEEVDMLRYAVNELEEAALNPGDEDIAERHAAAAHAEEIVSAANAATEALGGDGGASDMLVAACSHLRAASKHFPQAADWVEEAEDLVSRAGDLSRRVADAASSFDAGEESLEELDRRFTLLNRLQRKYRASSASELAEVLEQRRRRLEELEGHEEILASLTAEIAAAEAAARKAAAELTRKRRAAALKMSAEVTRELRDLGFLKSELAVNVEPADLGADGADRVVYMFAPNPGEAARPLGDIASSGEIARVMLSLKSVLAAHGAVALSVFDEIDANIGGEVGRVVGAKMSAVSQFHQVIAITHLPQSAVYADRHLVVSKSVSGGRTRTQVREACGTERVAEIARMLGGEKLTSVVIKHAEELLEYGKEKRR